MCLKDKYSSIKRYGRKRIEDAVKIEIRLCV